MKSLNAVLCASLFTVFSCGTVSYMKEKGTAPVRPQMPEFQNKLQGGLWVIAHRGSSASHPENTLPSFDQALQEQANMLEFDVQYTKDRVPVVIHDHTLERTTNGHGFVGEQTWQELQKLDAGSWKGPQFKDTRIPSLEQVLSRYVGKIAMNVEIKHESRLVPGMTPADMVRGVLDVIQHTKAEKHVLVSSFDHEVADEVRKQSEAVAVAYLTDNEMELPPEEFQRRKINAWNSKWTSLDESMVADFKGRGIGVYAWGVPDHEKDLTALVRKGVSGIFTNVPALLVEIMKR